MAKINDVYITVESETPSFVVDVTEQPVESGINLTDHVQPQAASFSITGAIVGSDAGSRRDKLLIWQKKGELVKFVGRTIFTGVITSFSTGHDAKIVNGCTFDMEIKEIRIAKAAFASSLPTTVKVQVAPVKNAGRKQAKPKKKKDKGKSIWEA